MKKLINKSKKIWTQEKGEALVESVVSLLVFTILVIAVTMAVDTSLHITAKSMADAAEKQDIVNRAVLEEYDETKPLTITIKDPSTGIDVQLSVKLSDEDNFISFSPEVSAP